MNINAVIRELRSHYDGWLLIEQDTTNVDATSTAREKAVLFGKCSEDRKANSRTTLKCFTVNVGAPLRSECEKRRK